MRLYIIPIPALLFCVFVAVAFAQQTNPVDRQVANPITDTPNINPVAPEKDIRAPKHKTSFEQEGGDGEIVVYSDRQTVEGEAGKRIVIHSGNVDARYGIYRLQADKITIYEAEQKMIAEGSVIFDQGDDQRITGSRGIFNYKTKLGRFEDSTGFTNQTNDGTVIYFIAERVEKIGENEIVVTKGKFTACEEAVPKWSFTADEARIKINDKVKLKNAKFRVKDVPLVPLPFVWIPIKQRDRSSGFLTPAFGYSRDKGFRMSGAYYQTLGLSADVTIRGELYGGRGIGYGMDFRTRANSRSYFNFGFFAVEDRIFGPREDAEHPDQGGTLVYAEGIHYFPNGFTAAADVRLTSNLAFRQVFSDSIQQIISPIETSEAFVNKSWNNYTLNLLGRAQEISIPNVRIKTRNLPGVHFEKRPSVLSVFPGAYFSFKTSVEGISRRDQPVDIGQYVSIAGSDPVVSPFFVWRFDAYPQITIPFSTKYFNFTATAAARISHYTDSFNDMRRVVGSNVTRKYGEFEFNIRPVALAKNFYGKNNSFRFRHVIEPFVTYRLIRGVNNFNRIIRFDHFDTISDTNEIEYGLTNRIYTRRNTAAISSPPYEGGVDAASADGVVLSDTPKSPVATAPGSDTQPYEIFTLTVRGKYFFDPYFGGALIPGRRNQLAPMTALSFYTFGGVPRRFSPLNIDATYRPQRTIFFNSRMDVGMHGDGIRAVSTTLGYDTPLVKIFQTFYYTRAVTLGLRRGADASSAGLSADAVVGGGKEPGTLRGSQWSPSIFLGNRDRGLYGGASLFFDFENRRAARLTPLISSLYTLGYAYDCCALALQYYTFNVGARRENRIVFSFRLNGLGTIGTEQFGQGLR